jgi:4-amino-4-deoxy-L-arabinose transferase-like glycosyltransferase
MTSIPIEGARPASRRLAFSLPRVRPELAALLALAALLYLWALQRNGLANEYYSAAVRAMSSDWHAFLYGSFDAAGVMTVDKPPLALWVQALSVKVFGFHSLSLLVPQALMGVASVALVYDLVRRRFGRAGGFAAGLVLALTPISVAIARHNNPDALLVLCSVAALWCVVRALEDGGTRWLVLAGVAVGLGFEAKMAAALMVVPGIAAAYLWVAPRGRVAAVRQLLAGGAAMVVVGSAWPALIALTPADSRPWVSGTSDNSILSLILGYNGLGRLGGQAGGPGGMGGGDGVFGGDPGVLRLLDSSLGGQAGWLLGFAVVGGLALLAGSRLRRADARTGWLIAVGGAFAITAVAFSAAEGIFHPYYVSLLAPFTAALVGAGAAQLAGGGRTARILAPAAVVAGLATELAVLGELPGELETVAPVMAVVCVLAAAALAAGRTALVRRVALAVALAALLVVPASWSVQTLGHATSGTFPAGGPESAGLAGGPGGATPGRFGGGTNGPLGANGGSDGGSGGALGANGGSDGGSGGALGANGGSDGGSGGPLGSNGGSDGGARGGFRGGMFGGNAALSDAVAYVEANGGGTIAVSSQSGAASAVLRSNVDVAALGGFSGRESEVSVDWLADRVADGTIRWVLTDGEGGGMPNDGRTGSSTVMAAVQATCAAVSGVDGLYDCSGAASALAAAA